MAEPDRIVAADGFLQQQFQIVLCEEALADHAELVAVALLCYKVRQRNACKASSVRLCIRC